VSLLNNGDYERIWDETRRALALVAPDHLDVMLSTTASRLYELREPALAHGAN
jgi:hypothetical protein